MEKDRGEKGREQDRIDGIGITEDVLTGRGGLAVFVRYLRGIEIYPHLERLFGSMRRSRKGQPVSVLFKQLICYFVDGTSWHVRRFDELKRDRGYGAAIEVGEEEMASSHTIKRFMRGFWWQRIWLFRRLMIKLFVWRLGVERPEVVIVGLDTVVLDNQEAQVRHGVRGTYKRVRGFQPLCLTWEGRMVDAVFRGGSTHGNHESAAIEMVRHVVRAVRKGYREEVPIIVRMDAGFYDQKVYEALEGLGVGYTATGKFYEDIKRHLGEMDLSSLSRYDNGKQAWDFVEFGDKRKHWRRYRRVIYLRPEGEGEGEQQLLEFARPDTLVYTNIGRGEAIDAQLQAAGHDELMRAEKLIEVHHHRGDDELVFRAFKEFGHEELPFKRFNMNAAYFYTMVLSFVLLEAFKHDVGKVVVPVTCYATRVRRTLIDIAAKIVRHGGKIMLKVTRSTAEQINLVELWRLSGCPPRFSWS